MTARKKSPKKKLELEKRRLEDAPEDDLAVDAEEAEDIKGGFAPPYVPVMPSERMRDPSTPPNLSLGSQQSDRGLRNG
jgi:hypothetical protein